MKRFILYLAVIGLTVYLAILYKSQVLTALAVIEILVPVPLILLAAVTVRMIHMDISPVTSAAEKGKPVQIMLTVENRSPFPVTYGVAEVFCWNEFRIDMVYQKIFIQAAGRSKTEFICEWSSSHCGKLIFEVKSLKIQDYIHLLTFLCPIEKSASAAVLPVPYPVEIPPENRSMIQEDGETFDRFRSGDDPSEVFDIREYRPGDRMSRIHWKMTAKEENLMVKEFSRPLAGEGVLYLDLYDPKADGLWNSADDYLELLLSFCLAFLEANRNVRAVWKEQGGDSLRVLGIEDEASVYELLCILFELRPYSQEVSLEDCYREQYPDNHPAFQYRLDLKGRLWEGGNLLWEKGWIVP